MEVGFTAPVQTGAGTHPASYTTVNGSFPGVKRQGGGVDHTLSSSAEVKEKVQLYIYSPSEPSWPFLGCNLPLPLPLLTNNYDTENYPEIIVTLIINK